MTRYRCPDNDRGDDSVMGCGHVFDAEPDYEGLVDCPSCGIWFNPHTEPATVVSSAAHVMESSK